MCKIGQNTWIHDPAFCTVLATWVKFSHYPKEKSPQFYCNYYLGGRLFAELQGTMDEEEFRLSLKELYRMNNTLNEKGEYGGIREVKTAFPQHEGIIEKHWSGQQPMAFGTPAPPAVPAIIEPATPPPGIEQSPMPPPVLITMSTPAPKQILLPTSTPVPVPTPTPTPIPPNIHAGTVDQYSYSIELPRGWTSQLEQNGHAAFLSPQKTAGAELRIQRMGEGGTAILVDERNQELLARMRAIPRDSQSLFEMKPHRPPAAAVTEQLWQAWQMEYRWRESPAQCIRDVVDVVSPSNRFTHSVLISTWVCEDSLDKGAKAERQGILGSFRGKTTG